MKFVIDKIQGSRLEMEQTGSTLSAIVGVGQLAKLSFSFVILKTLI